MFHSPLEALKGATRRRVTRTADPESGMTTAEYAVGTIAACGFAGVLYKAITSTEVLGAVKHILVRAFQQAF